jgi:YidC/Oxa1 family membrane protein insertase
MTTEQPHPDQQPMHWNDRYLLGYTPIDEVHEEFVGLVGCIYFILPLLMTASSLLQTWLNPTPPDPLQAKLMWIMPLAFSFMFFFFPAGLVLYWLTNNILSIAQQWFINKRLGVLGK